MIKGYCRVSTKGQEKHGNSLADQQAVILANYPGAEIVSECYSGAKVRPLFEKLVEELQSGDTLVVTKLDRFCRSTKEGLEYVDRLLAKDVRIHILNMGVMENTPIGRLLVTQLLAFAEFERAIITERMSSGRAYKKANDPEYKEGRPKLTVDAEKIAEMQKDGKSPKQIYTELGISKASYYNIVKGNVRYDYQSKGSVLNGVK